MPFQLLKNVCLKKKAKNIQLTRIELIIRYNISILDYLDLIPIEWNQSNSSN